MENGQNMAIGRHAQPLVEKWVHYIASEHVPTRHLNMEVWVVEEVTGKKDHVTETLHAQVNRKLKDDTNNNLFLYSN